MSHHIYAVQYPKDKNRFKLQCASCNEIFALSATSDQFVALTDEHLKVANSENS